MATITDLPFQERIDQSSGASSEGFLIDTVRYSGNVSQQAFAGATAEASRSEKWSVHYSYLAYATPQEVLDGSIDELGFIRDFYQYTQLGLVRWKPFEYSNNRIWRIVPNSLKVTQIAGCNFKVKLDLEFLYTE